MIGNMTIYDFLMQSSKDIQAAFRSKEWFDTYKMIPADIPSFCKSFNLDMDQRVKCYGNIRGFYFHVDVYINEFFKYQPVKLEFSISGRNRKIVVHFLGISDSRSSSDSPHIGRNFYIPGMTKDRECWDNLGYDIPLGEIADKFTTETPSGKFYYNDDTPIGTFVDRLVKFSNDFTPYYKLVYESFYNGEFEKVWKRYLSRDIVNGDMTNSGFGVGLRGIANLMYWSNRFLQIDLNLDDVMSFVSKIYDNKFGGSNYPDELKPIASIFFWNRNGYFDDYSKLTKDELTRLLKKYKK